MTNKYRLLEQLYYQHKDSGAYTLSIVNGIEFKANDTWYTMSNGREYNENRLFKTVKECEALHKKESLVKSKWIKRQMEEDDIRHQQIMAERSSDISKAEQRRKDQEAMYQKQIQNACRTCS